MLQPTGLLDDTPTLHGFSVSFLAASRSLDKSGASCVVLYLAKCLGLTLCVALLMVEDQTQEPH